MKKCYYSLEYDMVKWAMAVVGCLLAIMVAHLGCEKRIKTRKERKFRHLSLGYGTFLGGARRPRRWNSAVRWRKKIQLRGILFLSLMGAGNAMGQQQQQAFAEQVPNQVSQLARASNEASVATSGALRAFQVQQGGLEFF